MRRRGSIKRETRNDNTKAERRKSLQHRRRGHFSYFWGK